MKEDGALMKKIWSHIISGKKNWMLILLGCVLAVQLLGCSPQTASEYRAKVLREDDDKSEDMKKSIIDALDKQDAEALKGLFSEYALENAEDLDEKIEELMEFYSGSDEAIEGGMRSSEGGKYYEDWILNSVYTLKKNGQEYELRIVTIPMDKKEPDKVGLYLIEVMTEDAEPEDFKWRNEEDAPGIYVLDPQEKHW